MRPKRATPLLIDNYNPTPGGQRALVGLIHNTLEGSDKDRLDRNANLKESKPVYACPVITGEDIPHNDAATLARMLVVRFDDQPENAGDLLAVAQEKAHHRNAMVEYGWTPRSNPGQKVVQDMRRELNGSPHVHSAIVGIQKRPQH